MAKRASKNSSTASSTPTSATTTTNRKANNKGRPRTRSQKQQQQTQSKQSTTTTTTKSNSNKKTTTTTRNNKSNANNKKQTTTTSTNSLKKSSRTNNNNKDDDNIKINNSNKSKSKSTTTTRTSSTKATTASKSRSPKINNKTATTTNRSSKKQQQQSLNTSILSSSSSSSSSSSFLNSSSNLLTSPTLPEPTTTTATLISDSPPPLPSPSPVVIDDEIMSTTKKKKPKKSRKNKIKDSKTDKKIQEIVRKMEEEDGGGDDDDTEEEDSNNLILFDLNQPTIGDNPTPIIKLPILSTTDPISSSASSSYDPTTTTSKISLSQQSLGAKSSSSSTTFEPHHHSHHFVDASNQSTTPSSSNYMSSFNQNLISSSSTSAFSMVSNLQKASSTTTAPNHHHHLLSTAAIPSLLDSTTTSTVNDVTSSTSLHHPANHSMFQHHHVPTTPLLPPPNLIAGSSTSSSSMNPIQSLLSPQHQQQQLPATANTPGMGGVGGGNDSMVHDLPNELLQQGWRKCWSKREGRAYFFNKITNESVWEMPKTGSGSTSGSGPFYDPLTDPLGIQQPFAPPSLTSSTSSFQHHHPGNDPPIYPIFNPSFVSYMQQQRNNQSLNDNSNSNNNNDGTSSASSATTSNNSDSNNKKSLLGPFDFEIESNCYIWEGLFFYYFHPHPDVEIARANFVYRLRQQYKELCKARQNLEPPKDSFTRWIIERKISDKGYDPFLSCECPQELSQSLYQEIMQDIPIKLIKPKFSGEARKQLSKYAEAAKNIIDHPNVSAVSRKIVKWNVEDAFQWIRKTFNATYEDYMERLEHLKKQCQPHIIDASKQSIEMICIKLNQLAAEYARRIRELNLELFKKEDLRERGYYRFPNQKKVICYPAYLINPCCKLPTVTLFNEKDLIYLRYNKTMEILRLQLQYLQKLELLYYYNCRDDRKYSLFLTRVWCLLKRYQSFYDKTEGLQSQNSLPLSVFANLNKHFGVTFECFSNPLNCYFRQYCSFFPDTDGYFGSRGSILNFYPMSGSFQAYPPDSEDLIETSLLHFEKLLENTMEPLSFIIFIQEKPEISEKILKKLQNNKFKRFDLLIPAMEHELRNGMQHLFSKQDIYFKSTWNTLIYFLQNDSGFLKWSPTPERIEELLESFKIGRDNELIIQSTSFMQQQQQQQQHNKSELEIRSNGND